MKFLKTNFGNFFYSQKRVLSSWHKFMKLKFWIFKIFWHFQLDNQKWWLHINFQLSGSKNVQEMVFWIYFLKFLFWPQKTCFGPYSPGGCLRPKLLPPLGIPWALVSNPLINRISIFWSPRHISKSSQNSALKQTQFIDTTILGHFS